MIRPEPRPLAVRIAVPLVAVAGIFTGLAGVIAVCIALSVIAVVTAVSR